MDEIKGFANLQPGVKVAIYNTDENLAVEFYEGENEIKDETGLVSYIPCDKVRIFISKNEVRDTIVKPEHIRKWPKQFEAYKAGKEQIIGTKLTNWPFISKSQIRQLEFCNVFSVEQLAALSNAQKANIGLGVDDLQTAAKAYLEDKKGNVAVEQSAEIAELKKINEDLQAQLAQVLEFMKEHKPTDLKAKKKVKNEQDDSGNSADSSK